MKRVMCLLLAMLTLSSCGIIEKSKTEKKPTGKEISAVWISYTELSMKDENGGNEDSFRDKISEMFDNCAQLGINTKRTTNYTLVILIDSNNIKIF